MDRQRDLRRSRARKSRATRRKVLLRGGRPRLAVFRSNRYIYAQVIDDTEGRTLAAASSREAALAQPVEELKGKVSIAARVGQAIGERALAAGVDKVVFDRRFYRYHGRVKSLAEAARKSGLEF